MPSGPPLVVAVMVIVVVAWAVAVAVTLVIVGAVVTGSRVGSVAVGSVVHGGSPGREHTTALAAGQCYDFVPMTLQLFGMSFSPYSEKARWALDHHRVPFRWREHVPMAGELALRLRAGSLGKKASVPLAVDGDVVLRDSAAIARHAEKIGKGASLAPDDPLAHEWDEGARRRSARGVCSSIRRSLGRPGRAA